MWLKFTGVLVTLIVALAGINVSVALAAEGIGSGAACQNQQQYEVDQTVGSSPIGNTPLINLSALASSANWSRNTNVDSQLVYCATRITLSNSAIAWVMPQAGESYAPPSGLTIMKVQVMAFDGNPTQAGDDCGGTVAYHQSYDTSGGNNVFGDIVHILTSPSAGPFTSSTGLVFTMAAGVLMCQGGGSDSGTLGALTLDCTGNPWLSYNVTGCSHTPASGQQVTHYDVYAMQTPTPRSDLVPPIVQLTAPAGGSTVSGSTVAVSATATDDVAVQGVDFRLSNGADLGAGTLSAPNTYSLSWNSTIVPDGTYTVTAIAADTGGNASSSSVAITVKNAVATPCTPPLVGMPPNCTCPPGTLGSDCHNPTCVDFNSCLTPIPIGVGESLSGTTATIRWNPVSASNLKGYVVDRQLGAGAQWVQYTGVVTGTSIVNGSLPFNTQVSYRVHSVNIQGVESAPSAVVVVGPIATPNPPRVTLKVATTRIKRSTLLSKGLKVTVEATCPCGIRVDLTVGKNARIASAMFGGGAPIGRITLRPSRNQRNSIRHARSVTVVVTMNGRPVATKRIQLL